MTRCIIVDDEDPARRHLGRLLAEHADFEIVGEASNGIEALQLIADCEPEVMFLDIQMPGLSGFDVLAELSHPPLVVFATAYDEYAVRAFDANAIDYLLKPIQPARLSQTIEKLKKPMKRDESALRRVASQLQAGPPSKLAARRGKRIVLLSPREIVFIALEDQIVFLHTQTDRFATGRTITDLEELLSSLGFLRVSRSAIANLNHARELLPWSSGTWKLKMSNNAELDVSRDRGRQLKSRLG